jgi:hypothetical protein
LVVGCPQLDVPSLHQEVERRMAFHYLAGIMVNPMVITKASLMVWKKQI